MIIHTNNKKVKSYENLNIGIVFFVYYKIIVFLFNLFTCSFSDCCFISTVKQQPRPMLHRAKQIIMAQKITLRDLEKSGYMRPVLMTKSMHEHCM